MSSWYLRAIHLTLTVMPKGNPNPNPDTRFTTDRPEPLSEKITLRITASMMEKLKALPDNKEFIRQAIEEKFQKESSTPAS